MSTLISSSLSSIEACKKLLAALTNCSETEKRSILRLLLRTDTFFLLWFGLGRKDIEKQWLFERCKEFDAAPNGYIDLWARDHYKSTIITFAGTIKEILASHGDDPVNPREQCIGIFSHTRPIAKAFLRQIKQEFEGNELLKTLFPDILWDNPAKEAPKWSEDDGITVKRKSNPKEQTLEAWGLVDGQPTSKHFTGMVFDDVVTRESVTTPEMIQKTTDALKLSFNLGSQGKEWRRMIGTRYHFNDTYKPMIESGTFKPRIHTATDNGEPDGEPVLLSRETLALKRRDFGPYIFSCFVGDTPILMSDWSQRNIKDIVVGDEVVGYEFGQGGGKRATLVRSKVVALNSRWMPVVRFTFESGRSVVCTRDHKFWHGRAERGYSQLGLGKKELSAACTIYDPEIVFAPYPDRAAGYVAGMLDGEGSISGATVHVAQSMDINPTICSRIEQAFKDCGISLGCHISNSRPGHRDYYVTGGRQGLMRFMHVVGDAGKRARLEDQLYRNGTRNIGKGSRDKLISIDDAGLAEVFNIQTETGNYVANGYAVKNCQMLQNPKGDETQGFHIDWLRFCKPSDGSGMTKYILVDAASGKRKSNDYTAVWVIGLGEDKNYYALEIVRDRLNLTQRAALIMRLHRKWRPQEVRYERYGLMADIEHIKTLQDNENYRFEITEVGGQTPKNDRIKRLIPMFEQGRFYLPNSQHYTDYEGTTQDLVNVFIEQEYKAFPVPIHDDMLDSLARIAEPELNLDWPMTYEEPERYSRYGKKSNKYKSYMTA